ncbi:MAG: LysM peptidoglycan-binding domain-containing protein [Caldilineaceae bacterium]
MNTLYAVIPWLFGSAVFLGGAKLWWVSKKKMDRLYPERPANPDANFLVKALTGFQNEAIASLIVIVTLFSLSLAGQAAWFFVGKVTIGTAAHATILGAEGLSGWFTSAADAISNYDGGGINPEEMQKIMEEKSLLNQKSSFYVPAPAQQQVVYAPAPASLAAANANAPIAPASSAAVGQPGPVESAIVAEQVAAPAPVAPVQAAQGNTYAVGSTVTVLPGDTLFKIAQRAYGDGELWKSVCRANQNVISNCDNLAAGMRLTIPAPTYVEQVVSVVTNSESNPVASDPAVAPQGLAADGRVYYDVAIPTPVPASAAVGVTMNSQAAAPVQDNTQIANSTTIQNMVTYDTTSLTPVPAAVAVQAAQPTATVAVAQTTADLMGKPSVDTGPAPISASR